MSLVIQSAKSLASRSRMWWVPCSRRADLIVREAGWVTASGAALGSGAGYMARRAG